VYTLDRAFSIEADFSTTSTSWMLAMNKYLMILLILASANSFGAVNRWVDSDGHVHYSDHPPPPGTNSKILHSTSDTEAAADSGDMTATSAPAAPKTLAEKEAELKKAQQARQEAADKAAKEQANAEALKSQCVSAQQYLRALQEGIRMVEIGADGERSYLDDAQRQQRIAKTQQDISAYCK
jgi:hypothetical protein